jgi:hypothetical protein
MSTWGMKTGQHRKIIEERRAPCGCESTPGPKYCTECGTPNDASASYCTGCGKQFQH